MPAWASCSTWSTCSSLNRLVLMGLRVSLKLQLSTLQLSGVRSTHPNHVWSCDFVHDQTRSGTGFKVFTMVDEHTRECLAAHAAWSLGSKDVIAIIAEVMARRGAPGHLRSDNGPEFIAYAIRDWLGAQQVGTLYIWVGPVSMCQLN